MVKTTKLKAEPELASEASSEADGGLGVAKQQDWQAVGCGCGSKKQVTWIENPAHFLQELAPYPRHNWDKPQVSQVDQESRVNIRVDHGPTS